MLGAGTRICDSDADNAADTNAHYFAHGYDWSCAWRNVVGETDIWPD
jgi:hypothetical protein